MIHRTRDVRRVNELMARDFPGCDMSELLAEPMHVCLIDGESGAVTNGSTAPVISLPSSLTFPGLVIYGAGSFSAGSPRTYTSATLGRVDTAGTGSTYDWYLGTRDGTLMFGIRANANTMEIIGAGSLSSTRLYHPGEGRFGTLRIDATPTAATPVPTHTVPININGTVYRVPCVI